MVKVENIIKLVSECNSDVIDCDCCKWENLGICKSELAYKNFKELTEKEKKEIPEETQKKLVKILLFDL